MLIVDNYDSFTYNLAEYVKILGITPVVIKNDEMDIESISALNFERIIISPGYGNPSNSGVSLEVIRKYHGKKPILGVCLGHQCIAKVFGGEVIKSNKPCHGKTSGIYFKGDCKLYQGLNQGFKATRYHSLVVDRTSIKPPLILNAETSDGLVMGLSVRDSKTYGVQFHPEAILTESGMKLIENFINL